MALGTTGITTAAVGTALGSSSRDVGTLCKHSAINKWAKGKPVPYPSDTGVTDHERRFCNQGFDLNSVTSISISQLLSSAQANKDWTYIKPSGGANSPYRLGDFRGYNHNAVPPYNFNSFPVNVETTGSTANASFRILIDSNAELKLSDFVHFENYGNFSGWRYAIAYKKSNWNAADTRFAYGSSVSTSSNEIIIDVTFPEAGTYTVLPVITKETGVTSDAMESIYLPNGLRTVTVTKKNIYATVSITNDIYPSFTYDGNLFMFGNMMQLSVTNTTSGVSVPSTTGRLKFQIIYYDAYDTQLGEFTFTDYNNGDFTYSGTGAKSYTLDYNAGAPIYLPDYISYDMSMINKIEIYADVEKVSGSGLFQIAKMYKWTVYKN